MDEPHIDRLEQAAGGSGTLVLVLGYLGRDEESAEDNLAWVEGLREAGWDGEIWVYRWDSSFAGKLILDALGPTVAGAAAGYGASVVAKSVMKAVLPRIGLGVLSVPLRIFTGIRVAMVAAGSGTGASHGVLKHWRVVRDRAEKIGRENLLSDIAAAGLDSVTLVGHSLGARMIDSALRSESDSGVSVDDVVYFGAALDRENEEAWRHATSAVGGLLVNVYHTKDRTLRALYERVEDEAATGLGEVKAAIDNLLNVCADSFFASTDDSHSHYRKHIRSTIRQALWRA